MMNRVRTWLTVNKILFETLAASLLSLMAIIISVAQTRTASEQTSLLTLQTRIAEAQALPQFEIAIHQERNSATGKFDDNILVISNRGGPVHEFSADSAYFITVTASGDKGAILKAELPINGYFTASLVNVSGTGKLVTMIGYHNNAAVFGLSQDLRSVASARHFAFANLDEQIFVRLGYRDLMNRMHEDYYRVEAVSGGTRIPEEEGRTRFRTWNATMPKELSGVRGLDLLNKLPHAESPRQ